MSTTKSARFDAHPILCLCLLWQGPVEKLPSLLLKTSSVTQLVQKPQSLLLKTFCDSLMPIISYFVIQSFQIVGWLSMKALSAYSESISLNQQDQPVNQLFQGSPPQAAFIRVAEGEILIVESHGVEINAYYALDRSVRVVISNKIHRRQDTEKMFTLIGEKDVITWNTMIAACSQCDDHGKALCVYREMENESNQRPDDFTYASALSASAGLASIRHGKQIHAHLIRALRDEDTAVSRILITLDDVTTKDFLFAGWLSGSYVTCIIVMFFIIQIQ